MQIHSEKNWIRGVHLTIENRQDLLRRYLSEPPHGGLMISLKEDLEVGELVELRIKVEESDQHHQLRGVVLWCRAKHGVHTAGVGFLSTEVESRERLFATPAAIPVESPERHEPRYAATLKVSYHSADDFVVDYTRNLSKGGFFVENPNPPAVGSRIRFRLAPPGSDETIEILGQVAWKRPGIGFGVRFAFGNHKAKRAVEDLVRNIAVGSPEPISAPVLQHMTY